MTGYTVSSLSGNTDSIADCLEDNQTNSTACVNQSRIAVVVRSDETGNETESSGSLFCEQLFHGETSKVVVKTNF